MAFDSHRLDPPEQVEPVAHDQFATKTLTYQLDLLSRRALLQHLPTAPSPSSPFNRLPAQDNASEYGPLHTATGPSIASSTSASAASSLSASPSMTPKTEVGPTTPTSHTRLGPNRAISQLLFALSSTRSSLARRAGLSFRALGGGEGGVLDLKRIKVVHSQKSGLTATPAEGDISGAPDQRAVVGQGWSMDVNDALRTWHTFPLESPFVSTSGRLFKLELLRH